MIRMESSNYFRRNPAWRLLGARGLEAPPIFPQAMWPSSFPSSHAAVHACTLHEASMCAQEHIEPEISPKSNDGRVEQEGGQLSVNTNGQLWGTIILLFDELHRAVHDQWPARPQQPIWVAAVQPQICASLWPELVRASR